MTPDRRAVAAALLGAAFASPAWSRQPGLEPLVEGHLDEDHLDETPTALDTLQTRTDHLLAPVTINGQGPFNFLIDTGASASCLSERVARRLNLPETAPARVITIAGSRVSPRVIINELGVGARTRRRVKTAVLPIRDPQFDGILGVDWLERQRLHIDFERSNLEIGKSKTEESEKGRVVVPARRRFGQLTIIDADLGGRQISALVDTGSQITVCNGALRDLAARQDRTPQGRQQPEPVTLQTLMGEIIPGHSVHLPFVRLGGLTIGAASVVYADVHIFDMWDLGKAPALILGMDLLTQFKAVALDYGRSAVRFDFA